MRPATLAVIEGLKTKCRVVLVTQTREENTVKKADVRIGEVYTARITDKMSRVRITAENPHGGWDAVNLETNRKVRIKSPQKLRRHVADAANVRAIHAADQENARLAEERAASPDGQTASERAMAESAPRKPKGKKKRDTGERGATGGKLSGLDAAVQVLREAGEPLNTRQMVERMLAQDLWTTDGKTPHNTLYASILRELKTKGADARFRKVERGKFTLAKQEG